MPMNIYDIAKLAGVSIATVSRVVNDSPKVSERTKAKVRAIMEEQNYTPNVFARGLGLNSMNTVGIVCPDVSDTYMACAVAYLEKSLGEYGYDCILYCSGYEPQDKVWAVQRILQKRIDALVLVGSNYVGNETPGDIAYLKEAAQQVPVFLINGYVQCPTIYCVLSDVYQITYDTVSKLIASGRKQILFLYNSYSYSAREKKRGYEEALRDHGLLICEELEVFVENKILKVRDKLFQETSRKFDAVVTTDDGLAAGALKYAAMKGIFVPDEMNIIGFNDSELAVWCEPELSSIDSQGELICKKTVDNMMKVLEDHTIQHKTVVPCHLVKRKTTNF